MASAEVYTAVHDHLEAGFTDAPLVFENEDAPLPDTPAALVKVEMFGDIYQQETIGAPGENLWRETGTILMRVLVPRGSGTIVARTHARKLVDLFREVEVDGIRFGVGSIAAGEPGESDGNYFVMEASVEFARDDY
ncbi:MAG TPA: hypothetical protein VMF90_14820 [Rhizobiaceae bacterium]|nr:hypothetical protein [Rhizobiaceae bacterium]